MPQVPLYDSPKVKEQGLPNAKFNADPSLEAFGGGQSLNQVTNAVSSLSQTVSNVAGEIHKEEFKKANDLFLQTKQAEIINKLNDIRYNPNDGLMTYVGQKAFKAEEDISQKVDKFFEEQKATLNNDDQRDLFNKIEQHYRADILGDVKKFSFEQQNKFAKDQIKTNIQTLQNDAALNFGKPGKIEQNMKFIEGSIRDFGVKFGLSPQEIELNVKEAKDQTHLAVIRQTLSSGDEKSARSYYALNKESIDPEYNNKIDKEFSHFRIDQETQRRAAKEQLEEQQKKTQNDFILKMSQGSLKTKDILNSNLNPVGTGSKQQFIDMLEKEGKRTDPETFNNLFARIHLNEDDPKFLGDQNELNSYFLANKLSRSDLAWLRQEMEGTHTADGQERRSMEKGLYEVAKAQLTKSNPMLGIKDPTGEENFLRFQKFAKDAVRERLKNKQPVAPLFDPNSKDWLGRSVGQFARSPQEIIKSMTQFTPSGSGTGITPPNATNEKPVTPPPARLPGESAQDYIKRIKGQK